MLQKNNINIYWIMDDDCMPEHSALKEFFDADTTLHEIMGS